MKHRVVTIILLAGLLLGGCSAFKRGSGSGDEDGMGEGNIPLAEAGRELKDVNFDFDAATLDEVGQAALRENAQWLLDNPNVRVNVEGHCDERGTNEYNVALGQKRAQEVIVFLQAAGVPSSRMNEISYGSEIPLDPGHDDAAWAKNRRVHFTRR